MRRCTTALLVAPLLIALCAGTGTAAPRECTTSPTKEQAEALLAQERAGAYVAPGTPMTYVLDVPLTMHVVRRSDGTGGLSEEHVDETLAACNQSYAGSGINFFQSGSIRFIDNTDFYENIDTQEEIDALRRTDVIANTVNVYFTAFLAVGTDTLCGKSSFTTDTVQGIVIDNACTMLNDYPSTFAHEIGHYLDLYHTHETAFGEECPDGGNCDTAGDLLCDTAADPDLTDNLTNCDYTGTAMRCGQSFSPDPTNLMSYGGECRTHFTLGQKDRALATLVNLRSNLVGTDLAVSWVDFTYNGTEIGTFANPWSTFTGAINGTNSNGTIVIKAGTSSETITTSKVLWIDSFRGTSWVGGP